MKTVLVMPTNRPEQAVRCLDAWQPWPWDETIVVFDGPEAPESLRQVDGVRVLDWLLYNLCDCGEIFSRGDSACRSFGFWVAVNTHDADVVLTIDDDCYPIGQPSSWLAAHLANLDMRVSWDSTVPGRPVRGLPYRHAATVAAENLPLPYRVGVSVGLWTGCPDDDSPHRLVAPEKLPFFAPAEVRLMPSDVYFPMCGMNLAFRKEVLPVMYFPPMGRGVPYRRFDDIWCGLLAQRIFRETGWRFTVGGPRINHRQVGDPLDALVAEAAGIRDHEKLWPLIHRLDVGRGTELLEFVRQAARGMAGIDAGPDMSSGLAGYVDLWGRRLDDWVVLCREALGEAA